MTHFLHLSIDHFTVVYLVAWPLNESEAGVDLVLTETSLLFFCKLLLISMININAGRFLSKKVHPASFSFKGQAITHTTVKLMVH